MINEASNKKTSSLNKSQTNQLIGFGQYTYSKENELFFSKEVSKSINRSAISLNN